MTKYLLIMLLLGMALLLGSPAAQAQAAPPPAPALADSAAQAAREDTAVAVQRLFFEQRRHGRRLLLSAGIGTAGAALVLATGRPETTYQWLSTGAFGLVAGYYTYQLLQELARQRRYRPAREQRVLAALEQGQPLPRRVRRRLGTGYFAVKITAR